MTRLHPRPDADTQSKGGSLSYLSLVVLVIRDSVEEEEKSAIANSLTFSYIFRLRLVTTLAAAALAINRLTETPSVLHAALLGGCSFCRRRSL